MRKFLLSGLIISALLLSVSCKSTKAASGSKVGKVYVTNTKPIKILGPEYIAKEIDDMYAFMVTFGSEAFGAVTYIQADKSGMYIDIMNDFGTSMGTLTYEPGNVDLDCALIPPKLKGEYIINDFQLAFYEEEAVRDNLKKYKLDFVVEKNEKGETVKSVYSGNKLIEEVLIDAGSITIRNILRGYSFAFILGA